MDFLIYAICFGVGLVFTPCSAVFGHFIGGELGHGDVGGHGDFSADGGGDMPGVLVLSPAVIAPCITSFGGFGLQLRLTGDITQIMAQLPPALESLTGVSFAKLLPQVPALKNAMADKPEDNA